MFIGRTDVEAETPILWPPDAKSWLIGKDPDARRDWEQEEKGTTEDEMAGWHHWLDAHEFGWTPGAGDGQGGLTCCDSWCCKEVDMTERLNWTECKFSCDSLHLIQRLAYKFLYINISVLWRIKATPFCKVPGKEPSEISWPHPTTCKPIRTFGQPREILIKPGKGEPIRTQHLTLHQNVTNQTRRLPFFKFFAW